MTQRSSSSLLRGAERLAVGRSCERVTQTCQTCAGKAPAATHSATQAHLGAQRPPLTVTSAGGGRGGGDIEPERKADVTVRLGCAAAQRQVCGSVRRGRTRAAAWRCTQQSRAPRREKRGRTAGQTCRSATRSSRRRRCTQPVGSGGRAGSAPSRQRTLTKIKAMRNKLNSSRCFQFNQQ